MMIFSQVSCGQNKDDIIGNWIIYDLEIYAPEVDVEIINETKEFVKSYRYDFKKNGTLFYEDEIIEKVKGTWQLNNDSLSFEYSFKVPEYIDESESKQHELAMKILTLSQKKMTWLQELEDNRTIKYFLEKVDN